MTGDAMTHAQPSAIRNAPRLRHLGLAGAVPMLGLLALLLGGCEPSTGAADRAPEIDQRRPVRTVAVGESEPMRELRLPGVLRAAQRAEPAFLHHGHLAERLVARGDRVVAGQRLATLQNPALGPALAAAEARVREQDERLVQLDADYERARELHARGLASADLLDRTLAQRNATREARAQALAGVAEARDQLADAILRAPFDATVSDLLIEPGDFVQAGQPVLVLSGRVGLEVEVKLPEGLARLLAPGDGVEVRALATGARAAGRIREVGVAREGRPAPAVVALADDADWEPGISVHVALTHDAPIVLKVPLGAIVDPGTGQTRVFRVVDGRAVMTPVAVGRLAGANVEVTGQLAAGDQVVVAGHQQLLDGDAVRVLP
jgi:RND family efflux transporter MFP subunit